MKSCVEECKNCQKYNDNWCICWNKLIKGSKVKIGTNCPVEILKEKRKENV